MPDDQPPARSPADLGRRQLVQTLAAVGVGSAVFGRALASLAAEGRPITGKMIRQAEWIAGVALSEEERRLMARGLGELLDDFAKLRGIPLDNSIAPALVFQPSGPPPSLDPVVRPKITPGAGAPPAGDDAVAFASLDQLGGWLRARTISSVELTRFYLERLRRLDGRLRAVITYTEDRALAQARRADEELAAGHDRGALHGIPWGAKDLLAVPGYPTTWGAGPYREQLRTETATVVERLDEAGAVLIAKLAVGELAWGDVWFGGTTHNPWNLEEGASGSSAGSAATTAAGLVGFAIGTETWGSIVSPCTRCGATGLRPTFGRVSRHGAMALSWSMDKIGPIARSVADCALVLAAIHGPDGLDRSVVSAPFDWPPDGDPRAIAIGFPAELFEEERGGDEDDEEERRRATEWREIDRATLATLREIGFTLVPIELPRRHPVGSLAFILTAEAATAFDELTRSGQDELLVRQVEQAWPNVLRQGQLIPAVEYLRANRVRALVMAEMEETMAQVAVYVAPTYGGNNLLLGNLTGHPAVVLPNGHRSDGTPTSITFTGRLHGETALLAVARAYQQATNHHLRRPALGLELGVERGGT